VDLVILVGLQASGKTSFCRERFAATHEIVSKDLLRNNRRPQRRQEKLIRDALAAGRSVVVDNTNPTVADRAPLVAIGRAAGATIVGGVFESTRAECLERNRLRTGKARVPDLAINAAAARFEPPRPSEGFDRLFRVRLVGNRFDVREA